MKKVFKAIWSIIIFPVQCIEIFIVSFVVGGLTVFEQNIGPIKGVKREEDHVRV